MKHRIALLFAVALLLLLPACAHSLEETEGVFMHAGDVADWAEACPHFLSYDYPTNRDLYQRYPNGEYHYVQCSHAAFGLCNLPPAYEKHTKQFLEYQGAPKVMYNGHYYHTALFSCTVCGSISAESEYVLCSLDSENCDGTCENAVRFAEGSS